MDSINCILHGNTLERLEKTLEDIKGTMLDIRLEATSTSTQLKAINDSVARVTTQVAKHEGWLQNLQSALDTAKGLGTGVGKWLTGMVLLSNAFTGVIAYLMSRK